MAVSGQVTQFDFIANATHMRPRDFINYIRDCARSSMQQGHKRITSDTIRSADKDFSIYFKEELIGEIEAIIPDIRKIFDFFSEQRRQIFSFEDETRNAYNEYVERENFGKATREIGFDKMLKILFHFSVIGNQPPGDRRQRIFKFSNRGAVLSRKERIAIHRGLLKALDIF